MSAVAAILGKQFQLYVNIWAFQSKLVHNNMILN